MAFKKKNNWRDGQTAPGMDTAGKARKNSGNAPAPRSARVTPADDGTGYTVETDYNNSGDGEYQSPSTSVHTDLDSVQGHLAKTFDSIDADETLDAGEKRRKKMKASMRAKGSKS